jgi:nitroreductase
MGAYDTVHLTVIQNPDLLDRITKTTANIFGNPDMKPFYGAPTVVVVSGKRNEKAPNIEVANAACIVENMALAATDIGLGSVYLWGFLASFSADKELLKELHLPEGFVPASAIALGHSTQSLTKEKELKKTISINTIK